MQLLIELLVVTALLSLLAYVLTRYVIKDYRKSQATAYQARQHPNKQLRRYQRSFWLFGLILGLSWTLVAFRYTVYEEQLFDAPYDAGETESTEIIPPTIHEKPKELPKAIETDQFELKPDDHLILDSFILDTFSESFDGDTFNNESLFEPEVIVEDKVYDLVQEMPRFMLCETEQSKEQQYRCAEKALLEYLSNAPYPKRAKNADIDGRVTLVFVIDEKGKCKDVQVARGPHQLLNDAAAKHVRNMPKWVPGRQSGRQVKVRYSVTIQYKLE